MIVRQDLLDEDDMRTSSMPKMLAGKASTSHQSSAGDILCLIFTSKEAADHDEEKRYQNEFRWKQRRFKEIWIYCCNAHTGVWRGRWWLTGWWRSVSVYECLWEANTFYRVHKTSMIVITRLYYYNGIVNSLQMNRCSFSMLVLWHSREPT